ncbi:hypothetical protein HY251_17275, partial [bacterium]|nr:hypothetical protein [bacterium]
PGESYSFMFTGVAPASGSYELKFRMVHESVTWFGGTSDDPITVYPKP